MNKHETARKNIGLFSTLFDENNDEMNVSYDELETYIARYEQLEKDVKRYFELDNRYLLHPESNELYHLKKTLKGR